jgi:hypothetical protein
VKIIDILPWPDPVEGDQIATILVATLKTYAVLSDTAVDAIALWVLHTWLANEFMISPRLAVTSPTKGCGKTTILALLNKLVRRPKRAGSISPPALFRVVEQFQPTILLDETEKYIEHGSDLHALLNEGHRKGGTVLRVLGEKPELREFGIFGSVAYARNGRLPDDLEQRSIIVDMKRRRPDEPLAELPQDNRCDSLQRTARMCARWADDNAHLIAGAGPDMGSLINRDADNWRPLFAIADLIGSDWPDRIREAAATLTPRESESTGPLLLGDTKAIFDDKATDRLASTDICEALHAMEGRPWAEWRASKRALPKPITKNQLAGLLKAFGIIPGNVRIGARIQKGYYRHQFDEAWQRYLTPENAPKCAQGVHEPLHRYKPTATGTSATIQSATANDDVAFQTCEKRNNDGHCSGVAVQKPGNGSARADGESWPRVCDHCGAPERPNDPIQTCAVEGRQYFLHCGCQQNWLAGPNPDDWSFQQDRADDPTVPVGSKVLGVAPGQKCELCGSGRDVHLVQLPDEREAAPRHKQCAARYWGKKGSESHA